MPTPLAHSFCGILFCPETQQYVFKNKVYVGSLIVFFSCLPDFDYFIRIFAGNLKAGHRLLTHSLFSPLIIGIVRSTVAKLMKKFFFFFDNLFNNHQFFLDYLSFYNYPKNGIGIALFWFKNFFLSFRFSLLPFGFPKDHMSWFLF